MDNLKKIGTQAFVWDFSGQIFKQLSSFVISVILARILAPEDFGIIAVVMVIIAISQVFTDAGLGSALIQFRHTRNIHYSSVFYFNFFISVLFMALICFFAADIAQFYDSEILVGIIQVISSFFIFNSLNTVQSVKFRKELNYKTLTILSLYSSVFSGACGVLLALNGGGIWSLVVQVLLYQIIYSLLIWKTSKWHPALNFSFKALRQLWGFGFKIFLSKMLDAIFSRLDVLIFAKIFPADTIGYYQRAKFLNTLVIRYSSGSLMAVLFPLLSKIQCDLQRFQNAVLKIYNLLCFVVFFIIGSFYLISEEFIIIIYGDKWLQSAHYLQILLLGSFAFPISALLVNVLSSRGNSKSFLYLEIYKKILLSINLYVGYIWGLDYFLYGFVVRSFIATYINMVFTAKEIKLSISKFLFPIVLHILIAIVSVLIVIFLNMFIVYSNSIMLVIKLFEYIVIYTLLSKLFSSMGCQIAAEEIMLFINKTIIKKGLRE